METTLSKRRNIGPYVILTGDALIDHKKRVKFFMTFFFNIGQIFLIGFRNWKKKLSAVQILNLALKENYILVSGMAPRFKIDYHKLLLSTGNLPIPLNTSVRYLKKNMLRIKWECELTNAEPSGLMVYVLQYNATKQVGLIFHGQRPTDTKLFYRLNCEDEYGDELQYWMFFVSLDGKEKSNSVYVGQVMPMNN